MGGDSRFVISRRRRSSGSRSGSSRRAGRTSVVLHVRDSSAVRTGIAGLLLAGSLLVAGCSGDDEIEPGAHRLTLTDTDCTYEGATTFSSTETFEAEVVNESAKLGAFEIAKLDEGHTFAEVEAYVESARQRVSNGLRFVPPPIWMTLGERAQLEPGQTGSLVSTVTPGTWVLWCAQEHPPSAFFLMPELHLT